MFCSSYTSYIGSSLCQEFEINIYIDDAENRIGLEYYSS